jgi:hypothetical protein
MKNSLKALTFGLACVLGATVSAPVLADALYVKGDIGFLADGNLYILDMTTEDPGSSETTVPEVLVEVDIEGNATDVTVEDCRASVTTTAGDGSKGVEVVDLLDQAFDGQGYCSDGDKGRDEEDQAIYDSHKGTLSISCVYADDTYYDVVFEQRGSSSNWELTYAEPNENCED